MRGTPPIWSARTVIHVNVIADSGYSPGPRAQRHVPNRVPNSAKLTCAN